MNLIELLHQLGLEHQEANVYLSALRLGTSPASIIGKKCGIPRSTARYTCEQLIEKQLMVGSQKGNTKLFTLESPEKLQKLLDMQQEDLEVKQQKLEVAMQDLKRLFNPYTVMPKVRFYEGVEGLMTMFDDVLQEGKPLFGALHITETIHPKILTYLNEVYTPKRAQLKNPAYMLFNDNPLTYEYRENDKNVNRTSLLLPEKDFPFDVCCHIYSNKVAFYSYEKADMTGVLIENELIKNTQFSIFRLAWNQARQLKANETYKGIEI